MNLPLLSEAPIQGVPGGAFIIRALRGIVNAVGTAWDVQHNDDGTHNFASGVVERGRTTAMGAWVHHPFSALDFVSGSASGSTWTVPSGTVLTPIIYTVIGKTMGLTLDLSQSSTLAITGAAPTYLQVNLPDSYRVASLTGQFVNPTVVTYASATNAGSTITAEWHAVPGDTFVRLYRIGSAWVAGSVTAQGQLFFEVA